MAEPPPPRRRSPAPVPPLRPFDFGPDSADSGPPAEQRADLDRLIRTRVAVEPRRRPPVVSLCGDQVRRRPNRRRLLAEVAGPIACFAPILCRWRPRIGGPPQTIIEARLRRLHKLRIGARRRKYLLCSVSFFVHSLPAGSDFWPAWGRRRPGPPAEGFQTLAPFAILVDAGSGTVLFEKNADALMSPASTAKILTAELVFQALKEKRLKLDDTSWSRRTPGDRRSFVRWIGHVRGAEQLDPDRRPHPGAGHRFGQRCRDHAGRRHLPAPRTISPP